jgi:predicted lipase
MIIVDIILLGMQVAITDNPLKHRITVIFRGTDEYKDWLHNFHITKTTYEESNIKIHAGFQSLIAKHGPQLDSIINNILSTKDNYSINVTGHSLGGALAILYGYTLALRLPYDDIQVITFGSPRVGNYYFKKAVEKLKNLNILRVTNDHDMIPAYPIVNYCHVGNVLHVRSNETFQIFTNNNYSLLKYSIMNCWSVTDHYTISYWENLKHCEWENSLTFT